MWRRAGGDAALELLGKLFDAALLSRIAALGNPRGFSGKSRIMTRDYRLHILNGYNVSVYVMRIVKVLELSAFLMSTAITNSLPSNINTKPSFLSLECLIFSNMSFVILFKMSYSAFLSEFNKLEFAYSIWNTWRKYSILLSSSISLSICLLLSPSKLFLPSSQSRISSIFALLNGRCNRISTYLPVSMKD